MTPTGREKESELPFSFSLRAVDQSFRSQQREVYHVLATLKLIRKHNLQKASSAKIFTEEGKKDIRSFQATSKQSYTVGKLHSVT